MLSFATEQLSYRETAWQDCMSDDAEANLSRCFRAVAESASQAEELLFELQSQIVETNLSCDSVPSLPESFSVTKGFQTKSKSQQISFLRRLFFLLKHLVGDSQRAICCAYRSLCLGFRLSTPHKLKQALF